MKKILLSLLAVFILLGNSGIVYASITNPLSTTTAKAPDTFPNESDTVSAILDSPFDFSRISFSSSDGTSTIAGHDYMRKIMISLSPNPNGATIAEKLGDNWFTVYCLDGELKFPMYSFANFDFGTGTDDDIKLQQIITFKLFNDGRYGKVFEKAKGMVMDPSVDYTLDGKTATEIINEVNANTSVTIKVKSLTYTDVALSKTVTVTAAELSGNPSATEIDVVLNKSNMMFDNYYASNMNNRNYNHALWIIEHSYPTHSLEKSLMLADASYNDLVNEIKTYHTGTFTDEEYRKIVENYVYSTVQYAIWYVNDGIDVDGKKLGKTLIGSTELNKLYQYLIKDRSEYNNYSQHQFNNDLTIVKPNVENEIYSETKEHYTYGPYSVKNNFVSADRLDLSLPGVDTKNASIVDSAGNALTTISPDGSFYIKVAKSAKIANLQVKIDSLNVQTFFPTTNRGKIYTAYYPLVQNVASGGKIVSDDITKNIDIVFNPKTGQEDIAIIFVISLVAFSLAYLVLSLKSKQVGF